MGIPVQLAYRIGMVFNSFRVFLQLRLQSFLDALACCL
jgi:hypothetical protein